VKKKEWMWSGPGEDIPGIADKHVNVNGMF
jgi:hypothetical protein